MLHRSVVIQYFDRAVTNLNSSDTATTSTDRALVPRHTCAFSPDPLTFLLFYLTRVSISFCFADILLIVFMCVSPSFTIFSRLFASFEATMHLQSPPLAIDPL